MAGCIRVKSAATGEVLELKPHFGDASMVAVSSREPLDLCVLMFSGITTDPVTFDIKVHEKKI